MNHMNMESSVIFWTWTKQCDFHLWFFILFLKITKNVKNLPDSFFYFFILNFSVYLIFSVVVVFCRVENFVMCKKWSDTGEIVSNWNKHFAGVVMVFFFWCRMLCGSWGLQKQTSFQHCGLFVIFILYNIENLLTFTQALAHSAYNVDNMK